VSLSGLGTIHSLRLIFHGVDRVSSVTDTIQSKVRALGGAISILGGTGILVTNLGEQFGFLSKQQANALDKTFSLVAAVGSLISIFAKFAPAVLAAASAQNIMNAATAVADALSGPLGWALLAAAAVALTAWGLSQVINQPSTAQTGTTSNSPTGNAPGAIGLFGKLGQFGLDTTVTGPTMFLAGESGSERVSITPVGKTGGSGSQIAPTINIYGATDPAASAQAVKRELEALISREVARRG
jgi:hypothetical protein